MNKIYLLFLFVFILSSSVIFSQNLVATVENSSDNKPISSVHVINLTQVIGVITDNQGKFEIPAKLNDTLYLSYLGFKSMKVKVTNDLLKFENSKIQLTELAYALEEVIVKPYELTGYLEIDAKNVPLSQSFRYSIPGLPSKGYEGGSRNSGAFSKVINSIFNPVDFLYNLFGKNPRQLKKLKQMKEDYRIRELLSSKFDRETLEELLQIQKVDIDEILRNCNFSDSFIETANDLQILDAISGCYEEFKVLNRK
ncbi:MAG: carboxypeptidase-like regulatory domain-containing protein [Flavobacteriaceae bacterium]|nr:carboxypeptidase-like regulatory domain-containing protein [Flavobacteriaceae bacterium]